MVHKIPIGNMQSFKEHSVSQLQSLACEGEDPIEKESQRGGALNCFV